HEFSSRLQAVVADPVLSFALSPSDPGRVQRVNASAEFPAHVRLEGADGLEAAVDAYAVGGGPRFVDVAIEVRAAVQAGGLAVLFGFVLLSTLAVVSSLLATSYRRQAADEATRASALQADERRQRIRLYALDMQAAKRAADEASLVELQTILLRWAPRFDESDLRGFEWFHLWQLCESPAIVMSFGHELPAYQVLFLPEHDALATSGFSRSVSVWPLDSEVDEQSPLKRLRSPSMDVGTLFCDQANSLLIVGDDGGYVSAFSTETMEPAESFRLTDQSLNRIQVASIDVSADGRHWAIGAGNEYEGALFLRHRDDSVTQLVDEFPGAALVAYSSDDEMFAAGYALDELRVFSKDLKTCEATELNASGCYALAASPTRDLLAISLHQQGPVKDVYRLELWSMSRRRRLWTYPSQSPIRAVAFSSDGRQLAWGDEAGVVEIAAIGSPVAQTALTFTRRMHSTLIRDVAFSSDDKQLATASTDGFANVWSVAALAPSASAVVPMKHDSVLAPSSCFFNASAGGAAKLAATSCRGTGLVIWDAKTGELIDQPGIEIGTSNHIKVAAA
ncbi:MAG: hypothetical protein AAF961_12195, partial [Planctomycetota bacterium]